ncbi:MAG: cytochrome [Actinomycetia bacterium]|nr:cytochrome [Actinomycetes bacterium]
MTVRIYRGPTFDPLEPGFTTDPYDQYARLRAADPVHRSALGPWVLSRYEDVNRLLRDPSTSVDRDSSTGTRNQVLVDAFGERRNRGTRSMLNADPPDHTRLRRLVSKAFTPRMVEGLRPRAQAVTDALLDAVDGPEVDLIAAVAFPLPFTVICDMLGMPVGETRDEVRAWSHTLAGALEPIISPEQANAAAQASDHLRAHLLEVLTAKRRAPGEDLLSALLLAEDDGDVLSIDELLDQVNLLFVAGHETTVNLIGNGVLALLRHPDQLDRLRRDPSLVVNATDELLRWDSPVQISRRILLADQTIGGVDLPAGSFVLTLLGSANRDEARWGEDAAALDVGREGAGQHLSFGAGIHHCLGAALARVEGQVAFGSLLARYPGMALATDTPAWNGRVLLRGLDSLPVSLG